MKIIVTILFGLMCVLQVNAQKLTRKTFAKTEWFSDNYDSIFYKSDTIKLIKYSNLVSNDLGFNEYAESEGLLFKNPIYVHFKFNRFGTLDFWNIEYHWSTVSRMGERKWRFFKKEIYYLCIEIIK